MNATRERKPGCLASTPPKAHGDIASLYRDSLASQAMANYHSPHFSGRRRKTTKVNQAMEISKNSVVSFFYELRNEHGELLESNFEETPSLYLHGANNIIPGLEKVMAGKSAGEEFEVTLQPTEAYGLRQEAQQQRIPAKYLKHEGKLKAGQIVRFNTDQGTRTATVIKVGKFSVDVDSNHPLAGQVLSFKIKVNKVREASSEELSHGHAHGEGGHQH